MFIRANVKYVVENRDTLVAHGGFSITETAFDYLFYILHQQSRYSQTLIEEGKTILENVFDPFEAKKAGKITSKEDKKKWAKHKVKKQVVKKKWCFLLLAYVLHALYACRYPVRGGLICSQPFMSGLL